MTITKLRAIISAAIAILSAVLSLLPSDARAATATLLNCSGTTSVTGQYVYVGTYQYAGQVFQMTFRSWCPYSVEVQ